jgi:hypothetical protein
VALNEKMLSESRQTLTIPAGLMLRMMAAMARRSREGRGETEQRENAEDSGDEI